MANQWRATADTPKVAGVSIPAYLPLLFMLYVPSFKTLGIAIASIIIFGFLSYKGLSVKVTIALISHKLRGRVAYAKPWWYRNRMNG